MKLKLTENGLQRTCNPTHKIHWMMFASKLSPVGGSIWLGHLMFHPTGVIQRILSADFESIWTINQLNENWFQASESKVTPKSIEYIWLNLASIGRQMLTWVNSGNFKRFWCIFSVNKSRTENSVTLVKICPKLGHKVSQKEEQFC